MTKPVAFNEDGARRVIAATKAYESGNRNMPPVTFRQVADDGDPVRLGKTTADWEIDTTATIDVWESGTPGAETQTTGKTLPGCVNKFVKVSSGKWVIVAKGVLNAWYLVWAEPEELDVIVGVSLESGGLTFAKKKIQVYVKTPDPQAAIITTTACP